MRRAPDLALGVVLALVNVVSLLPYRGQLHPLWLALLLVAGQALPLALRQRFPVPVMVVVGACRVAYDQTGFGFAPFPLAPAIALYTVCDHSKVFWRTATIILTAVGITISLAAPGHAEPYEAIYQGLIFGTAAVAGLLGRSAREQLRTARQRAEAAEAALDSRTRSEAAAERSRIARELHDVIAHHISLVAVQSEAVLSLLPARPAEAATSAGVIGDTARQALTELRRLLGVLRRPSEPLQTEPSASLRELPAMLDQVRGAGLAVDLTVTGEPFPPAPGVDITAYRIVQEALTNTVRHSAAARAHVTVAYRPGFVTVSVRESGERAAADGRAGRLGHDGAGLGLAGIAERVAACGGSLMLGPAMDSTLAGAMDSDAGNGFVVSATLPSP